MPPNPYATTEPVIHSTTDLLARLDRYTVQPDSTKTERGEQLRLFMRKLNKGRIEAGFKPLTEARLGKIFEGKDVAYMYWLDKRCEEARSYSRMFSYLTDPKKRISP